jgi:hypothetical protein
MIALSPAKLALYSVLFFVAGLEARPIINDLVAGRAVTAMDVLGTAGVLLVGIIALTQAKRIPA